jgi:hypothetical protein
MAFEGRADAEGNNRHAVLGADAHGIGDLRRRLREEHGVGRFIGNFGQLVAVLAADRFALGQPLAEAGAQLRQRGRERVGSGSRRRNHSAAHLAEEHVSNTRGRSQELA